MESSFWFFQKINCFFISGSLFVICYLCQKWFKKMKSILILYGFCPNMQFVCHQWLCFKYGGTASWKILVFRFGLVCTECGFKLWFLWIFWEREGWTTIWFLAHTIEPGL